MLEGYFTIHSPDLGQTVDHALEREPLDQSGVLLCSALHISRFLRCRGACKYSAYSLYLKVYRALEATTGMHICRPEMLELYGVPS